SLDISGIQGILDALRVNHGLEEEQVHLLDRRGHRLYPEFTANPVSPLAAAGASDLVVSGTAAGRSRYPDLGWTVTLIYPAATVFEPQLRLRRNLLTIALLGLLAVLVVAGLVSVSVTRPMRAAVGVANRVAEGDLSLIEESKAGGEIGELLDALRMMVAKIRPIVTRIRATSKLLGELAPEFTTASQGISSGAEKQALATAVSRSSVEEMVDSMRVIASNTEELGVEVADTSAAIEQMAVSGDSVAQNARRLATGVSDTVALAHHLAESVAGVAVSASKAAESSQAAVVEAQAGGRVVRDTAEEIAALTSVIEQVAAVNGALAADNERIHGIVHLLESIGGKTKLLALNAAIQATQAGPYGRSFGVVAAEIRALAEDSSASARRMGKLLESVHSRIGDAEILSRDGLEKAQRGVDMVTNAGRSLERIVASAGEVDRELSDIRRATAEQAAGSEQLQTTFHRMSTMTEEVATATEQQGRGGERILGTVRRVHGIAERFSEAVRGHSAQGEAVESSITQIVEIAAQSETSAKEIVAAATALEQQVAALRSVSGFFDPPASKAADDS
ncbi:MAG: methyl-accepting chemotaxis protein, partial [Thermoanaerobaculia bacterium]